MILGQRPILARGVLEEGFTAAIARESVIEEHEVPRTDEQGAVREPYRVAYGVRHFPAQCQR